MTANIKEFAGLIPDSVLDVSGKVFVSGRNAVGSTSQLYIYGLNPGGAPRSLYPRDGAFAYRQGAPRRAGQLVRINRRGLGQE